MANEKFSPKGVYCAMITPFDENGKVNLNQIEKIIEFLIDKQVDGVFPVSNVGEFLLLSMAEKKSVIKAVIGKGRGRIKVIPGISDVVIDNCLELAEFCKEEGADGVVLCTPYYYPYSQEYIKEFINCIADNSPLPVILYNSPNFTNSIEFENLIEICKHKNITAIKESSGDMKFLVKLIGEFEKQNIDKKIMIGWEELLYTGITLGAHGCIVSSAAIVPELMVKIYKYLSENNMDKALECQKAVVAITNEIKKFGFPQGYKLGVIARGFDFNICKNRSFHNEELVMFKGLESIKNVIDEQLRKTGCI